MLVRDVMTREVHTLRDDQRAVAAEDLMEAAHIRHVPVVDASGRLVGIVCPKDILKAAVAAVGTNLSAVDRRLRLAALPASKAMHQPVHVIRSGAHVQEAASLMRRLKVGCLPVVDDGQLVGVISSYDVLKLFEHLPDRSLGPDAPASAGDPPGPGPGVRRPHFGAAVMLRRAHHHREPGPAGSV